MKLAIDASNIRGGGGLTHLLAILNGLYAADYGFEEISIWTSNETAKKIENIDPSIVVYTPAHLSSNVLVRYIWSKYIFPITSNDCHICFSPGGLISNFSGFKVTMCRNLLPFEKKERNRYSWFSILRFRWELLRILQGSSFKKADGLIFLTEYAQSTVCELLNIDKSASMIINHGVEDKFFRKRRSSSSECNKTFRFLYVSTVSLYKHHVNVCKAISSLRESGHDVVLDIYGKGEQNALKLLDDALKTYDPDNKFLNYYGATDHDTLCNIYAEADGFVYASSCENLPNILLEAMASGLPICCSNFGPMPEILGDTGIYFNPENAEEIEARMQELLTSNSLCVSLGLKAQQKAKTYRWATSAQKTLSYLHEIAKQENVKDR